MSASPYPHLAPELQALGGDALRLWGDTDERRRALEAIVTAWDTGSTLATVLDLDAEQLWKSLWQHPPGELRAAFPRVVDALYRGRTGSRLGPNQLANLRGLADLVFREDRSTQVPSLTALMATWRVVLR